MSRFRSVAVGVAVLGLFVFVAVRLLSTNGSPQESDRPAIETLVVPGSGVIRWSPDATKLAFIVSGQLVIVRVNDATELARRGSSVVDAAWMPDSTRVLLVEGPIPTGQVVAVRADGRVQGTTKLTPSLAFAQGQGLAVNSTGTQAASIAVRRAAIGGTTQQDLAVMDLQRGGTKTFVNDTRAESNPVFVDDSTVAYAAQLPGGQIRLHTIDLVTGQVRAHGPIYGGPYGSLASGEIVVGSRAAEGAIRLDAVALGGGRRVLGVLPRHTRPVAIDRFGTRGGPPFRRIARNAHRDRDYSQIVSVHPRGFRRARDTMASRGQAHLRDGWRFQFARQGPYGRLARQTPQGRGACGSRCRSSTRTSTSTRER